jgi:hypothetical protein
MELLAAHEYGGDLFDLRKKRFWSTEPKYQDAKPLV